MSLKLDLGCGNTRREGFVGVDLAGGPGVIQEDLFKPSWIWDDDSIDEIFCSHFVEHVPDLVAFMDECYRILRPGGKMTVIHPYQFSVRAWQDPTHVRALNEVSWLYFNKQWRDTVHVDQYGSQADFDVNVTMIVNQAWAQPSADDTDETEFKERLAFATRHYVNVIDDLEITLVKGG